MNKNLKFCVIFAYKSYAKNQAYTFTFTFGKIFEMDYGLKWIDNNFPS